MDTYFISTNNGWIKTNVERMALMPFTIDEMIANPSVLDPSGTPEDKASRIFFVTKNDKDYWEFGKFIDGREEA